ncbi:dihydroxyacetone kinase subunit DhaK [Halodesulfovibrio marinisediminis]|uniref:Dihydroxyacetone kinase DhaK subunit n=1 Tax=Halodesulfovibrio marinisediminis DSM 17456 TaxID=1121457 RepID=A0A1N6FVD7_9BACT|nr:dihydroxyacetone kinase subunit DhaK [Halodesulfovibrio marinisediminis]SIN99177.1 dihydroxyacetone kinase DhaK subunit [Halodesulfovibrio marinisediminis DSM 17456]
MKKLINDPENVVNEQLQGLVAANSDLLLNLEPRFVYRENIPEGKVAIVSGGGSGHDPLHCGYVGNGMLDGACPGEIFTSPTPDQIYECAKQVHRGAGVLFLVKNYTGDVLNFETAAELCVMDGMRVQCVLIDDDVAVKGGGHTAGRRGIGITVLAEKIVGAAAQAGYSLEECADLCRRVNQNGRSMGVALSSCIVPIVGEPTFLLGSDEVEIGIGIHGEQGVERRCMSPMDELVENLVGRIFSDPAYVRVARELNLDTGQWEDVQLVSEPFVKGNEFIVLVNGMGGTPLGELYGVYRKLVAICEERGVSIIRNLVGTYISALEMQGCSISLLRADDEMVKLWDARVETPALRRFGRE